MSKLLKYARYENERRFLLGALPPGLEESRGYQQLDDLYLEGTRLRLRMARSPAGEVIERKLNQKILDPEGDPARRIITSVYLDAAEYAVLAALPGRRLAKRRYVYSHEGRAFGIDVFSGPFAGLVLAEIELASVPELHALAPPAFAHCEVTALPLFSGGELTQREPAEVLAEARRLLDAVVR